MSERKVLNKYYPPDFDPTKLPKLKRERNKQFVIRIMAPFSMQCKTCGEYIYKGRKFNSRMETAEGETYLGLRIYRFHIRCTKCISVITFKTDPENTDYTMEHGATRLFEAYKKLEQQVEKEKRDRVEEETNNPMKSLENRTQDSRREMETLEKLEELRDLNQRIAGINPDDLIQDHLRTEEEISKRQEAEDEELVRKTFRGQYTSGGGYVKRIIDNESDSDTDELPPEMLEDNGSDMLIRDILDEDLPGPAHPPPKKTKLKTPFDDLSSMIRLKKTKSVPEQIKAKEVESVLNVTKEQVAIEETASVPISPEIPELQPLPSYKINLKKPYDINSKVMKGTSLNLLGGYNSSEDSSSGEEK